MQALAVVGPARGVVSSLEGPVSKVGVEPPIPVAAALILAVVTLPLLRPSGPANSSPLADVPIVLAVALSFFWLVRTGQPFRVPYGWPVALLVLGGACAGVAGAKPSSALTAISHDVFVFAWCLAIANVCRSPRILNLVLRMWSWSGAAWACVMIVAYLAGRSDLAGVTERTGARAQFTLGDPNMAASYFFVALMAGLAYREPLNALLRTIVCAPLIGALLLTGSNGGLASGAVALLVLALIEAKKRGSWPGVAACACLLGLVVVASALALPHLQAWAGASEQPLLRDSIGRSGESAFQREILIEESLQLYRESAPFGLGPGQIKPALVDSLAPYAKESHDDLIEAFVERGVVGGLGMLLLAASTGLAVVQLLRGRVPSQIARTVSPNILAAAMIGLAASTAFYQIQHFRHVWALLGILGAVRACGGEWRSWSP